MIRKFKETDLENVMKLWLETNISTHFFIEKDYWISNYKEVSKLMTQASIYVYEEDAIKGFIGLNNNYIAGIFVDGNSQSKGIGKALLEFIKEKHNELVLHVYKKNDRAIKFYLREGFSIEKERVDQNTKEIEVEMKWIK